MKKFVLLVVLIFFCMPVMAEYKPIPAHLSEQYKKEITKEIDKKYWYTKWQIYKIEWDAKSTCKKLLKNEITDNEYFAENIDMIIDSPLFFLYKDLTKITRKYVTITNETQFATDYSGTLYAFLEPYFKDNNINIDKLINLAVLTNKKHKQIMKYENNARKIISENERFNEVCNMCKCYYDEVLDNKYCTFYKDNILDKTYTCCNNNCYNFESFNYNKFKKSYSIDMMIDLMNWNYHQTYKSPFDEGDISHLIFKTELKNNELKVKYKGFVSSTIEPKSNDNSNSGFEYKHIGYYLINPKMIKNFRLFEKNFSDWINQDSYIKTVKNQVNNQVD